MHIKSLILATALAMLAAPVAFADPLSTLESCNGCAMSVQDYDAAVAARDARDNPPVVDDGDSGETYVPPTEPVEPTDPEGTFYGNLVDYGYPGDTAPGLYTVEYDGQTYNVEVFDDGTFRAEPIAA